MFVYLAVLGLVVACGNFLPVACGIEFPHQGPNLGPCTRSAESRLWTTRAVPRALSV